VIALLEGDERLLASLERATEVFVPGVVMGELFFGAANSGVRKKTPRELSASPPIRQSWFRISMLPGNMVALSRTSNRGAGRFPVTTSGSRQLPGNMPWFLLPGTAILSM
jgi:hypothetical protein